MGGGKEKLGKVKKRRKMERDIVKKRRINIKVGKEKKWEKI
jgi:hypothetical protein